MSLDRRANIRRVMGVVVGLSGMLVLCAAPASAATPEAPVALSPVEVKASSAVLVGVLDPAKQGEPGSFEVLEYQFLYKASPTECEGGEVAPEGGGLSLGGGEEQVVEGVEGLAADTEYTMCVRVKGSGGEATSAPVTFRTAIPPEMPITGEPAKAITATSAVLEGILNPNAAGDSGNWEFHYNAQEGECDAGRVAPEPPGGALGGEGEAVSTSVTGLMPGTSYTFCLLARNDAGEEAQGSPVSFTTAAGAPVVTEEAVFKVEQTVATVEAGINPEGGETTYRVEYGTSEAYGHSIEGATPAGNDDSVHRVSARITGLAAGTAYDYRVVASNVAAPGGVPGEKKVFRTGEAAHASPDTCPNVARRVEQPLGSALPECRAYEMVSPEETNGQDATDAYIATAPRAAVSGEALAYASRGAFGSPPGANVESELLSRRGADGWTTREITPVFKPHETEPLSAYLATVFSPDLSAGLATTSASLTGDAPLTGKGENDLYLVDFATGEDRYIAETYFAMGASTDLSRVVVGETGAISEWSDGTVVPVSVTNEDEPLNASVGDVAGATQKPFDREKDVWHAVSADGSRVYFTSPGFLVDRRGNPVEGAHELYVRLNAGQPQSPVSSGRCVVATGACTVEVSASQRAVADPHGPQSARFWGASVDGGKVFFTSNEELTENAYTGTEDNAANLYEYDLNKPEGERLADLTVDTEEATEGAAVQGVVQISEDGSSVYFVADGALTHERNAEGELPLAGQPNLYASHSGGAPMFVATLALNDLFDWTSSEPETTASPMLATAVTSPGGQEMAFVSERSLTGYDNREAQPKDCNGKKIFETSQSGTENCREVYLYNAAEDSLVCASCDPSGARPTGFSGLRTVPSKAFAEYKPRFLLEDGTLFFDSSDALVAGASGGQQNVYEYTSGHVYALSDVVGAHESFFMDASANGSDVFFATADDLVPQDTSGNTVVYDARVNGGFPASSTASTCASGETCKPQQPPQSEVLGPSGSAIFAGSGNLVPPVNTIKPRPETRAQKLAKALKSCRQKKAKRKRLSCEREARKRYRPARAKKGGKAARATGERGAGR